MELDHLKITKKYAGKSLGGIGPAILNICSCVVWAEKRRGPRLYPKYLEVIIKNKPTELLKILYDK